MTTNHTDTSPKRRIEVVTPTLGPMAGEAAPILTESPAQRARRARAAQRPVFVAQEVAR